MRVLGLQVRVVKVELLQALLKVGDHSVSVLQHIFKFSYLIEKLVGTVLYLFPLNLGALDVLSSLMCLLLPDLSQVPLMLFLQLCLVIM